MKKATIAPGLLIARMRDNAVLARRIALKARKTGAASKWDKYNAIARVWKMAADMMVSSK